jgi:hypothetical protein
MQLKGEDRNQALARKREEVCIGVAGGRATTLTTGEVFTLLS